MKTSTEYTRTRRYQRAIGPLLLALILASTYHGYSSAQSGGDSETVLVPIVTGDAAIQVPGETIDAPSTDDFDGDGVRDDEDAFPEDPAFSVDRSDVAIPVLSAFAKDVSLPTQDKIRALFGDPTRDYERFAFVSNGDDFILSAATLRSSDLRDSDVFIQGFRIVDVDEVEVVTPVERANVHDPGVQTNPQIVYVDSAREFIVFFESFQDNPVRFNSFSPDPDDPSKLLADACIADVIDCGSLRPPQEQGGVFARQVSWEDSALRFGTPEFRVSGVERVPEALCSFDPGRPQPFQCPSPIDRIVSVVQNLDLISSPSGVALVFNVANILEDGTTGPVSLPLLPSTGLPEGVVPLADGFPPLEAKTSVRRCVDTLNRVNRETRNARVIASLFDGFGQVVVAQDANDNEVSLCYVTRNPSTGLITARVVFESVASRDVAPVTLSTQQFVDAMRAQEPSLQALPPGAPRLIPAAATVRCLDLLDFEDLPYASSIRTGSDRVTSVLHSAYDGAALLVESDSSNGASQCLFTVSQVTGEVSESLRFDGASFVDVDLGTPTSFAVEDLAVAADPQVDVGINRVRPFLFRNHAVTRCREVLGLSDILPIATIATQFSGAARIVRVDSRDGRESGACVATVGPRGAVTVSVAARGARASSAFLDQSDDVLEAAVRAQEPQIQDAAESDFVDSGRENPNPITGQDAIDFTAEQRRFRGGTTSRFFSPPAAPFTLAEGTGLVSPAAPLSELVLQLFIRGIRGASICTGVLVRPATVLTAAHCLAFANSVQVIQARPGSPPDTQFADDWALAANFTGLGLFDFQSNTNDYAVLKLPRGFRTPATGGLVTLASRFGTLTLLDPVQLEVPGVGATGPFGVPDGRLRDGLMEFGAELGLGPGGLRQGNYITLRKGFLPFSAYTCGGDSGGPALLRAPGPPSGQNRAFSVVFGIQSRASCSALFNTFGFGGSQFAKATNVGLVFQGIQEAAGRIGAAVPLGASQSQLALLFALHSRASKGLPPREN